MLPVSATGRLPQMALTVQQYASGNASGSHTKLFINEAALLFKPIVQM